MNVSMLRSLIINEEYLINHVLMDRFVFRVRAGWNEN